MHVHRAELRAAVQRRHGLAGVEQALRVEGPLEGVELLEFRGAELLAHGVDFFHADAVLAGDGAACLDAAPQDQRTQLLGLFEFARLIGATPLQIYALMAVVGIGWGAMVSLPFAIVSQRVRQQEMGLFMGLFNLSVVLPQLVVSLGVALVVSRVEDKSLVFLISALALALATLAWSLVPEE